MKPSNKGFTLIELMIVITTIGLLTSLAAAMLTAAREKPRDAKRVSDVKAIMTALSLYATTSTSGFPSTPGTALGLATTSRLCDTGWQSQATPCSGNVYLDLVPSAPTVADGSCTPATNAYTYAQTGSGTGYTLSFCLGNDQGEYKAGVVVMTQDGVE